MSDTDDVKVLKARITALRSALLHIALQAESNARLAFDGENSTRLASFCSDVLEKDDESDGGACARAESAGL